MSDKAQAQKAPVRTPAEIEADMNATRDRLVGTIGEIEDRVKPANVAERTKNKVVGFYTDDSGVRWNNVALTAGAVVAGLVGIRVVSKTVRWAFAVPKEKLVPAEVVYVPVPREQVAAVKELL